LQGATYLERTAVSSAPNVIKTKRAIKKAFQYQMAGKGFSLVEVLSMCPTNWGNNPLASVKFVEEQMMPLFPLGVFRSPEKEGGA
jgi:2-oxoglutarate ferredoxin oxidoreductase subunit beta